MPLCPPYRSTVQGPDISPARRGQPICRVGLVLESGCRGGETVDALRSGRSVRKDVRVRLPPSAPGRKSGVAG